MAKVALILEGGGMRGAFTAGVLDYLLEKNIFPEIVIGISSGALYGCIYVAKQKELLKTASVDIAPSKKNIGLKPLFSEGQLVATRHIFDHQIFECGYEPKRLLESKQKLQIGVYDLQKYETIWKTNKDMAENSQWLKAACAIPIFSKVVPINNQLYFDGGLTTMIPIRHALTLGCDYYIVVTTKSPSFVRKQFPKWQDLILRHVIYRNYKPMVDHFAHRTDVYYQERALIDELVAQGKCLHIYPTKEVGVGRYSGNRQQFIELFELAKQECQNKADILAQFIE